WLGQGRYQRDGLDAKTAFPFHSLPPLAAAIGWLIVSHHRLPVVPAYDKKGQQLRCGQRTSGTVKPWLEAPLQQVTHAANETRQDATPAQIDAYWQMAGPLPVTE